MLIVNRVRYTAFAIPPMAIFLLLSLVPPPATRAQALQSAMPLQGGGTVEARLTAAPSEVTIGDVFTLTLEALHPADGRLVVGRFDEQWGPFEIRKIDALETRPNEGGSSAQSTQVIQASLWMTGSHTTPALTITFIDDTETATEIDVIPATVTVKSVLQPDDTELRDIKPQASLPIPSLWPWVLGGFLLAGLLGFLGYWLWRRRQNQLTVIEEAPIIEDRRPAHVKALEEIERAAQLHLPTQRRFAEHYDLITDALRRYLTEAYAVPAIDQTTSEIKQALPNSALPSNYQALAIELLEEADLVKFAQVEPSFAAADGLPVRTRNFVLETVPAPQPVHEEVSEPMPLHVEGFTDIEHNQTVQEAGKDHNGEGRRTG